MDKDRMISLVRRFSGVGVEVTTATAEKVYYFYEDFENNAGIDRAEKQLLPVLKKGKIKAFRYITRQTA